MDPRRHGGRMNARTTEDIVEVVDFDGREWLYLRSIPVDVAIIRATTADEFGNLTIEDEGAPLGVLDQALAAHNNGGVVIAQVKRLAKGRTLPAQAVRVPGIVVDAIVVAPDQLQTTQTRSAARGGRPLPGANLRSSSSPPWGPEKVDRAARGQELRDGEAVNLGFGISALVPRILLEEGLDGAVTWVIEQGAVGGVPFLGFAFGCAQNPDALHGVAGPVPVPAGRRLRPGDAVVPRGRRRRQRQRLPPRTRSPTSRRASAGSWTSPPARSGSSSPATSPPAPSSSRGRPDRHRQGGQAPAVRAAGPARDVQRPPRPRAGSGSRVRHRALRDPVCCRTA